MKFKELSQYFEKLEKTPSRLAMTQLLAELFKKASVEEIGKICYLSLGRLVPLYESLEFNLAEKMVVRAIAEASGVERKEITRRFKKIGDLGEVAQKLKGGNGGFKQSSLFSKKRKAGSNKSLTVLGVYKRLREIAEDEGQGSQERKVKAVAELLQDLDPVSVRYVTRVVVGKLRLGFSDKTIIDALSWMKTGDKSLRDDLEKAYYVRADIGYLAETFKQKGAGGLSNFEANLGVPVMPALCQRLKTADEMIAKMARVAVEPKWDGTRVAVHLKGKSFLKTFTRNLDETTHMFPELKNAYKQIKAKSVILDSEGVGVDPKTKRLLNFQQTIVRKRKHGVDEASKKVPLKFFVFDILYKDGKSLLTTPLKKRREILTKTISGKGVLEVAEQIETSDPKELRAYHKKQLGQGLEGAVVKKIDDDYIPGRRGWSWVKFKEEEKSEGALSDTLDCVVMGYYRGKGKRAEFGIGAFLVGVRRGEKFLTVAKVGTGLTDEQWKEIKKRADSQKTKDKPKEYVVDKGLTPDVWVSPKIVVEIAADNVTRSPNHSAGLALRFPRLIRFRDDKRVSQATSVEELKKLSG